MKYFIFSTFLFTSCGPLLPIFYEAEEVAVEVIAEDLMAKPTAPVVVQPIVPATNR